MRSQFTKRIQRAIALCALVGLLPCLGCHSLVPHRVSRICSPRVCPICDARSVEECCCFQGAPNAGYCETNWSSLGPVCPDGHCQFEQQPSLYQDVGLQGSHPEQIEMPPVADTPIWPGDGEGSLEIPRNQEQGEAIPGRPALPLVPSDSEARYEGSSASPTASSGQGAVEVHLKHEEPQSQTRSPDAHRRPTALRRRGRRPGDSTRPPTVRQASHVETDWSAQVAASPYHAEIVQGPARLPASARNSQRLGDAEAVQAATKGVATSSFDYFAQ